MPTHADYLLVLTTCSSEEEAHRIAEALVSEKAAACGTIVKDVRSVYFWQGKLEDDREVLLIMKTAGESFPRLCSRIKEFHSYKVPEIIALPIIDGSRDYLRWISEQTAT
jgi:periplasmic divalent cation tolerance protein